MIKIITKYIQKRLIIFIKIILIYLYCRNLYRICLEMGGMIDS